jgi:hypothetical protein
VPKDKGKARQEAVKSVLHQQANEGFTSLEALCDDRVFCVEAIDQHGQAKPVMPVIGERAGRGHHAGPFWDGDDSSWNTEDTELRCEACRGIQEKFPVGSLAQTLNQKCEFRSSLAPSSRFGSGNSLAYFC